MNDEYFNEETTIGELDDATKDGYQVPIQQQVDMSEEGISSFAQDR